MDVSRPLHRATCPTPVRLKPPSAACNRAKYERVIAYLPHFGSTRDRVRGRRNVIRPCAFV